MYQIPESLYQDFKENIFPSQRDQYLRKSLSSGIMRQKSNRDDNPFEIAEAREESLAYSFKIYLKNELEGILKDTDHIRYNDNSLIEISHIHLCFDHSRIHHLLVERGEALKNNNQVLKNRLEEQITSYIKENKEYLSTPKEAYIIFETEEAYHRAMKFNLNKRWGKTMPTREWKNTHLILRNIKEPTNITFENKFKNPMVTLVKTIIVTILLTLALLLTWYMIFYFQSRVNRLNRQYPEVNWENVIAHSNEEMLVNSAMIEYYNYETSDKSDLSILMQNTDNLQCYCDKLVGEEGYVNAMNKEFDLFVFDSHVTGTVWNDYLQSAIFIQLTGVLLPVMIIVFNLLLKTFAIILVRWMKFENKTNEIAFIQSVVFLLMFFNSALSILLINTNIPGLNQNGILFNGLYSDFSDDWYDKISQFFITPMFIQLISLN